MLIRLKNTWDNLFTHTIFQVSINLKNNSKKFFAETLFQIFEKANLRIWKYLEQRFCLCSFSNI